MFELYLEQNKANPIESEARTCELNERILMLMLLGFRNKRTEKALRTFGFLLDVESWFDEFLFLLIAY